MHLLTILFFFALFWIIDGFLTADHDLRGTKFNSRVGLIFLGAYRLDRGFTRVNFSQICHFFGSIGYIVSMVYSQKKKYMVVF